MNRIEFNIWYDISSYRIEFLLVVVFFFFLIII